MGLWNVSQKSLWNQKKSRWNVSQKSLWNAWCAMSKVLWHGTSVKRALHFIKRVLYFIKTALHFITQARRCSCLFETGAGPGRLRHEIAACVSTTSPHLNEKSPIVHDSFFFSCRRWEACVASAFSNPLLLKRASDMRLLSSTTGLFWFKWGRREACVASAVSTAAGLSCDSAARPSNKPYIASEEPFTSSNEPVLEWLRLVGSIKLWVSFAKEPYEKDAILQKRPII